MDDAEGVANGADGGLQGGARVRQGVADGRAAQRRELADELEHREVLLDGDHGATAAPRTVRSIVGRDGLAREAGRVEAREEALEVAEAVATVAARVDAVVAQPTGIAPGPDGVRVHAEDLGGARHRQGRVERSRMQQVDLRQSSPRKIL